MTTTNDIEQLFKTHYVSMHRMAMLILRDEDVARDIVHDVFESLLNGGIINVTGPYLLKAVRNRCLNHIRSLTLREHVKEVYAVSEQEIEEEEWPDEETIQQYRLHIVI